MIQINQKIKYLWHGTIREGYVTKIDGNSYTIRDTIEV